MPLLYTAAQANNYQTSNAVFADKGIPDLAPAKPNDLLLIGRPHQYEIAYGSYITSLPAFLKATVLQTRNSATDVGQNFSMKVAKYVPIQPPPLLLLPKTRVRTEDGRTALLNLLGEGAEIITFVEQAHVMIETPVFESVRPHLAMFELDNRSTTNTTNLTGYRAYMESVKILTAFLACHHYPAFQSPETSQMHHQAYIRVPLEYIPFEENEQPDYTKELATRGLPPVTPSEERRNIAGTLPSDHDGVQNLASATLIAQPSPFTPEVNFGPAGGVPYLPGYMLPYFDGLTAPDQNFLPSIMRRFFLRCFGSDDAGIDANFKKWRTGHTNIFRTNSGKILAHIFLCVQAALEAQARVYVVQSGRRYLGCAIVGYNFHLTINGVIRTPETAESLRLLLSKLDPHTKALEEIVEVLQGLELKEEGMDLVTVEKLKSGKDVWIEINKRVRAVDEDMKSLKDAVERLSFEDRFLPIAKKEIVTLIHLLSSDDEATYAEVMRLPLYLSADLVYDMSKEHLALGAFGPLAPSFLCQSGGRFAIPEGPAAADPSSVIDEANKNLRPLEKITVVAKKVPQALSDWKKMVRSREISQNQKKRDTGYKNVAFTQQARDEIWDALKTIPKWQNPAQKRRREKEAEASDSGSEDTGRPSKKQRGKKPEVGLFDDL